MYFYVFRICGFFYNYIIFYGKTYLFNKKIDILINYNE